MENVVNISISNLRSDLNIFKQCLIQKNYDMTVLTNDLQSKFDVQTSHINQLVQVNLILTEILMYSLKYCIQVFYNLYIYLF